MQSSMRGKKTWQSNMRQTIQMSRQINNQNFENDIGFVFSFSLDHLLLDLEPALIFFSNGKKHSIGEK